MNPEIFKAYDIRGVYPGEIDEAGAKAIGTAFAAYLGADEIAVGHDMRLSSPSLVAAFIDGVTEQGVNVSDYGMLSTDMMYFAVASGNHAGGAQITASHNPKQYNGAKLVREGAFPLSGDAGINDIRDMIGAGEFISGDFITALLAQAFLLKQPGSTVIYDLRASYAVRDIVAAHGGKALMNRVGHAFIKRRMRETNAVFGGEVTGHYYFRDNYFADNGMIPALLILELMSKHGKTLHELLAPLRAKYFIPGEINTKLAHMDLVAAKLDAIAKKYADGKQERLDGLSVEYSDWHFNVRPSNTEPLLRLNLEATTAAKMAATRDEVLALIRS